MAFSSIIGQTDAKLRLGAALSGTPGHAYIFSGPDGIGKNLLAREFAKALLCHHSNEQGSCGECLSCRHFENQVHPDFRNLQLDNSEKVIKVEKVRHEICADLMYKPQFGSRKVYLVNADAINEQGQNALLKSLEEPPANVYILLTVIGPERLLPTILSRANIISLRRYQPDEIETILTANGFQKNEKLAFCARFAGGLAGVAMDLAGSEWFADLRKETMQFYMKLDRCSRTDLLISGYQFFENNKPHVPMILEILCSLVRDRFILMCGGKDELLTNRDHMDMIKKSCESHEPAGETIQRLARSYAALLNARRGLYYNASFEALICKLLLSLRKEFTYA